MTSLRPARFFSRRLRLAGCGALALVATAACGELLTLDADPPLPVADAGGDANGPSSPTPDAATEDGGTADGSCTSRDSLGVYRPKEQKFLFAEDSGLPPEVIFNAVQILGKAGIPVSGDWNGDGSPGVGLYLGAQRRFLVRQTMSAGPADIDRLWPPSNPDAECQPIVGRWSACAPTRFGACCNDNTASLHCTLERVDGGTTEFFFGELDSKIVSGDWDGDGVDTLASFHQGKFFLRKTNEETSIIREYSLPEVMPSQNATPFAFDALGIGTAQVGFFYTPAVVSEDATLVLFDPNTDQRVGRVYGMGDERPFRVPLRK